MPECQTAKAKKATTTTPSPSSTEMKINCIECINLSADLANEFSIEITWYVCHHLFAKSNFSIHSSSPPFSACAVCEINAVKLCAMSKNNWMICHALK